MWPPALVVGFCFRSDSLGKGWMFVQLFYWVSKEFQRIPKNSFIQRIRSQDLGKRIAEFRKSQGLTQTQLAEILGI